MENEQGNVETDSVVTLEIQVCELVHLTDPITELRVATMDKEVDPILAGSVEAMAVGPWANMDTRQAAAPDVGHIAEGFEPRGDTTVIQPCGLRGRGTSPWSRAVSVVSDRGHILWPASIGIRSHVCGPE